MVNTSDFNKAGIYGYLFVSSIVVLLLYFAGNIVFPVIFSLFISAALLPVVNFLEKKGFSRFWSSFTVVVTSSLIFIVVFFLLSVQIYGMIDKLANDGVFDRSFKFEKITEKLWEASGVSEEREKKIVDSFTSGIISGAGGILSGLAGRVRSTLIFFSLVPIYIFFILLYRKNFAVFIQELNKKNKKTDFLKMYKEIKLMLKNYILGMIVVVSVVSALNSAGLLILRMDQAVLIGITTGVMTILPYIGVFVGALLPLTVALASGESLWYPASVILLYSFVQFIEGNYITPAIVGDRVDLNPLVIIIGMIVLGALGGVLAMIIAIPLLASLKIYFKNTDSFSEFETLMKYEKIKQE